jgi:hypothetical protein
MTYGIFFLVCHSRLSGVLLKKDSGQAGMTRKMTLFMHLSLKSKNFIIKFFPDLELDYQ